MSFRWVPKSVTLNDLERRNGPYFALFCRNQEVGLMGVGAGLYMYDVVVKSSRSLSHLLMSFLFLLVEMWMERILKCLHTGTTTSQNHVLPIGHRALKPCVLRRSRNHSMPVNCSQYDYHVSSSGLRCPPSTVAEAVGHSCWSPVVGHTMDQLR